MLPRLLLKRLGCSVDHSSPASTEVRYEWPCTLTALVCLHGMDPLKFELGLFPEGMRKTPSLLSSDSLCRDLNMSAGLHDLGAGHIN